MVPGSYWYVPAQAVHATACVSDTPCQFYFHADDAFDFTPVE
jgi:quercetin dioxygenase-like cupin family protein